MFRKVRDGEVCKDFPDALRSAFEEAVWFDELLSLRDELTHSDVGRCSLDKKTGLVSYIHLGIHESGNPLVIDDIFQKIDYFFEGVNGFTGRVFHYLNSLLNDKPVRQVCGIFSGRIYMRQVIPSLVRDFNSGFCESYRWFDLPGNPRCPFAESCGAYTSIRGEGSR
jgi:hypothetical protein